MPSFTFAVASVDGKRRRNRWWSWAGPVLPDGMELEESMGWRVTPDSSDLFGNTFSPPDGGDITLGVTSSMPKPTPEARKLWFSSLREPYLNFLRNLTPQVFLASMLWLLFERIDFTRFGTDGADATFYFFVLLSGLIAAVAANTNLFYEQAFRELESWRARKKTQLTRRRLRSVQFNLHFLRAIWRERFLEHCAAILFVLFVQAAYIIVVAASLVTAIGYLGGRR